MQRLLLLLTLAGCAKAPARPEKSEPTPAVRALYAEASQRLVSGFLENGWVVSRSPEGEAKHQGDSLIWSGLALYALSCEDGAATEDALLAEIERQEGALVRFPGLDKPVSMDGALGLYRGVADRISRCPGSGDKWAPAIRMHVSAVEANNGRLSPTGARLEGSFEYLLDLLAARLGVGSAPDGSVVGALANEAAAWAFATLAAKKAAYRIHLGLIALQTVEALGQGVPESGRNAFCAASLGAGLATTDHYCGRGDLPQWIEDFRFNTYEFAHQRATWESPDCLSDECPGLDLLVAIRDGYNL